MGTLGGGRVEHDVLREAALALVDGQTRRLDLRLAEDLGMCCGGRMEVYVEPIASRTPFLLFGAGHISAALAPLLHGLDFDVTVVDDRDALTTADRFPHATLRTDEPERFADAWAGDTRTFVLVVTHDHARDQAVAGSLLTKPAAWRGLVGSRAKVARFFERWTAAGADPATFGGLSAPVGLDVGAETPAEIAVAIAAEVLWVRRGAAREPGPLARRPNPARKVPWTPV